MFYVCFSRKMLPDIAAVCMYADSIQDDYIIICF